ncbi:MAG: hypothetical protein RL325_1789 [Planctomycetota bacterium]
MPISRHIPFLIAAAVAATLALACAGEAFGASAAAASSNESRATVVATGVAHLTGLAISPLLVLVALGWVDFASAGGSSAATLPLHANPWLLIPCSAVLALALLKKVASPAIPLPIRKVLDAAEYFEAKLSALVAAGVLLPTIVSTMAATTGGSAPAQAAGLASDWATYLWLAPLVVAVFLAVWISFHVVDALVVLSPFALLDGILVAIRGSVLALLAVALVVSPLLALALCVPIIVLSLLFAGWCIRLDLFALCVAGDILLARSRSTDPGAGPARAFLASRGLGAPIRTMGHAEPCERGVRFTYRPFFVLPRRTIELASDGGALVRGAIWSTMTRAARPSPILHLPPRYNPHALRVAARFRVEPRDGILRRAWRSLRDALDAIVPSAGPAVADDK